jgi:8-oxo-dGTP pyrophosphatase MutT (NUDIX family)
MKQKLKRALSQRQKRIISDDRRVPSAVLLLLYYKRGQYYILFTKRTETVTAHKGEVSFPGGAYEEKDGTLLDTALRECTEEIGLMPSDIELLGELDDFFTVGSNFMVSPFVAVMPWPYPLRIDPTEVAEVVEVPISVLLDKDCLRQETESINGKIVTSYEYHYKGQVIWGATARILNQFLNILTQVMSTK